MIAKRKREKRVYFFVGLLTECILGKRDTPVVVVVVVLVATAAAAAVVVEGGKGGGGTF